MESIRNFLNRLLPKGSAMRHVSILAGGTTIAQGLNVAIMPVLSRVYSPADFGVMAVFVSVTAIFTELSGFRYHLAIPLPKHERYAKALVVLSFFLQAVFVVLISLILLVAGKTMLAKLSLDSLIPYRYLIPVGVAGMGAYIALTQWAIREKLFQTIARTKVTQSVSGVLTKVVLGFMGFRPIGLLLGSIIGQAGGITTLASSLLKKKGLPKPPLEDIKRVALRYRKFPMYSTWSGMLNTVGRQIMPILLVAFYDPQVAGLFAMAQNLLLIPAVFIGQAIGQVFLQRASVARYEGNLKELSLKTYTLLLRLGFYPTMLISFFAPPVFSFVLGPKWLEAGSFARVLGPWLALTFAYSPMSVLFSVLDRQGVGLATEIVYITARVAAFWIGTTFGGPILSATLFGLVGFIVLFLRMNYLLLVSRNELRTITRINMTVFAETIGLLFLPVGALLLNLGWILISLALVVSMGVFFVRGYSLFKPLIGQAG